MSSTAWSTLLTYASLTPQVDLGDLNSNGDVITLAKALVYARTGDPIRRDEVIAALGQAQTSRIYRALELARALGAYVLAADYIGYRDETFMAWVAAQRTRVTADKTIVTCQEARPNNWGAWCTSARVIIDLYLRDTTDLARAVQVFTGWLGDRSVYAGFKYGDLSWQADPLAPVGINPVGATKLGNDIDGVLPDDERRASPFAWPPPCENYVHESLQGATLTAAILALNGYTPWSWSDHALLRAYVWLYAHGCPATGDDQLTPWVVNRFTGASFPTNPAGIGKGFGFTDWLFGPPS
jgi:hypothetical protein